MIHTGNLDQHARKFLDPDLSMQNRLALATEVRDGIEIVHTSEYLNFLKSYFRVFSQLLTHYTKPQPTDSYEHKLRNVIIEVLNRLPHNEVIRPFVQDLLKLSMHVLSSDNEENGLICLRIIFDLHKNFRPVLEPEVQPFLDFVCKIYQNFKTTVSYFFEDATVGDAQLAASQHNMGYMGQQRSPGGGPLLGQLNPSTRSFKVVTECPLIVMFLFQLYHQRYVQTNIPLLLPLMVSAISIPGPAQVPANLKNAFADLKAAQVKTVSFLTYLLKSFADYIRPHEESISKSIVNLLVSCPDSVTIRKELLVATRHVLATDFRRGFFNQIDTLLDERVLVGTGRACYETLRPLAYSLLAELIHHVRLDLSLPQLSRIVYLFSRNVHDSSLPLSVQTTCVRLMLNLVETIFSRRVDQSSKEEGRALLGRILDAFVSKFGTLKRMIPQLLDGESDDGKERPSLRLKLELPVQSALNLPVPLEHSKEVSDCKQLIRTLIMGMRTLLWSITNFNAVSHQGAPGSGGPKGMREHEVQLASGVLKSGVYCLAVFKEKEEEKEMFGHFSSVFGVMEHRNLMDMFSLCMPHLFECMLANGQLVQIFSAILQDKKLIRHFSEVLVNYLVNTKLDVLKGPDLPATKLVLQLFRLLFVAVSKFPADCERVVQPHVVTLMETCMKNATEVDKPLGYMQLLRVMFRPLSGGKFELLFREFNPTLQPCLNMLLAMVEGPTGLDMIDLVVELCLTMPARLSSLLPHLPRLMKPLVLALKGSDELIALGLRTLEFWIDSLNPEFLEPSMANVMSELILTLWSHLRPKPHAFGAKSLQLLGKLGGRNRRFLKEPLALECKENPEHGLRLILTFEPTTSFLVPLDRCIFLARTAVMGTQTGVDAFYRKQALKFLRVCLSSVLNLKGNVGNEGVTAGQLSTMFVTTVDPARRRAETSNMKLDLGVKTKTQLMAERSVFKVLLMTVIAASAEAELKEPKDDFVLNVCRHFATIFHVDSSSSNQAVGGGQLGVNATAGGSSAMANAKGRNRFQANLKELDPLIFLDALVAVLAEENRAHAKAALNGLSVFAETLLLLARSKHTGVLTPRGVSTPGTPMMVSSPSMNPVYSPPPGVRIPVFEQLLPRLLHCCYGSTWQSQMGGVMGLGALVGKATVDTLCLFQVRAVRALVYVLKRLPQHANKEQEETSQVLTQVLRVVNNVDETNNEGRRQSFQGVVEVLAAELFNPNATHIVRKNVQSCLALLASRTGSEVSELLEPLYPPLLQPLVVRHLRSKHPEQQVGTVMSLNFCLALRPPLLKMTPELNSLLQEALQIAEADENVLAGKFMNPKTAIILTKLRTVCIELLCTSMAWADFKTQPHADLRSRITAMFFKSLTCRTPEIVAVAKEGLRQVIQQHKMPKELLQSSLRPILVNLAHHKNLTMPLLQGLARLLELLSNWFNVTLGEKLMEHLRKWLEPDKLAASQKSWKAGEEPKIAAAIIELFHLLPSAAGRFLDHLVLLTIQLEEALPMGQVHSELNSPYRVPLTKFLNRYSTEAVDYFLARLTEPAYFRRFMDIIRSETGQPLRDELAKSPGKIISNAFAHQISPSAEETAAAASTMGMSTAPASGSLGSSAGDGLLGMQQQQQQQQGAAATMQTPESQFQGVALLSTIVKLMPDWLSNNRMVFDALVKLWQSPARSTRLRNEQGLSLSQVKESKRLVKCFLNYLRHDKEEVDVLFEMLSIFLVRTRIDYTFLKEFFMVEVAEGYTPQEKKAVLVRFLHLFQTKTLSQDLLVVAMQIMILPMLSHAFQNNQSWDVVDAVIIKTIVEKLLDPPEEVSAEYEEPLRIELLQLATLLLKYLPNDLVHHRKELIKFGWNHLKREESASKQWAFVNVCHFLEAYQAPEKIILQVFVALLRTCQPENRVLVKQALDILMPALPRRLPLGDSKIPIWIRYTKKILVEEGHSVPNLIHIFQLLVRHSDLFYACRAQFVPQMVNSLSRLGLPQNSPTENRRLAIDLAGLVVAWEKRRQAEVKASGDGGDDRNNAGALAEPSSSSGGAGESSASAGAKRGGDGTGLTSSNEDLSKRVKTESGAGAISLVNMSPNIATATSGPIPNIGTPGSGGGGPPDEEFKPNAAMEEMIINFLIRVALVTETKEKEMTGMYNQALDLLSQALEVWPNANIKFNYLEKLLSSLPGNQNKDPSSALAQGLDVMNKVLEKQPHLFICNNVQQIIQVLEPAFNSKLLSQSSAQVLDVPFPSKVPDIGRSLCNLLRMVFETFPVDSTSAPETKQAHQGNTAEAKFPQMVTPEVKQLHTKLEDLINKNLGTITAAQPALDSRSPNLVISFTLSIVDTLTKSSKAYIDRFMVPLVRVVQRLAREMGSMTTAVARQNSRVDQDAANTTVRLIADLNGLTTNLKALLKLVSSRVLLIPDCKKSFAQQMQTILAEKGADASVLLVILDIIKDWVENDFKGSAVATNSGTLNIKDVVSFLQRLAQVDRQAMPSHIIDEWEGKFLKLLHRLCSDASKYSLAIRQEVFQKVERQFMLGLRARDPEMRHKFFTLYHDSIAKTLFTRLQYIIQNQDWEALSDVFWLKQGLDLILAILVEHEPITLAPNSAQVPPLMASGGVPERPGMQQPASESGEEPDGAPPTFIGIVNKHARFLNEFSKLQVADLVLPLRELAHTDAHVAYHMWVLVFPIVWATLHKEEQVMLAKPMIALLSKDYHNKQLDKRPNVVQALLEGLSLSQPQPKIPSELIKFLGKTYNAWHIAISLLESHVMLFPQETRCFDALAELYRMLNEDDVRYGLWKRRAITPDTRAGLSLLQHGFWQRAQDVFSQAITKATQGSFNNGSTSKAEICLWEEQWVSCARRLNQWDSLVEFARNVDNYDILLDCLWKTSDWASLKETVPKAQVEESPKFRMVQAYVAFNEATMSGVNVSLVSEADTQVGRGIEIALHHWWQLPEMAVQSHIPLLQQFQQLVELQESGKVLLEIANGNKQQQQPQGPQQLGQAQGPGGAYVDLKDILETWRLRTPNEWDELPVWNDLLLWRNHMYNTVIHAFKNLGETNPQLHQLGFRDKAWSVNKLGSVARKQGLHDVCVSVLNKMYGFMTMEVLEAFVKIKEQAKAYLQMKGELMSGMNLINSTNLEYFPVQHKAEINRLKGEFYQRMNDSENANQAFSMAISMFKYLAKGWISWGNHCDQVYKETGEDLWLEYAVSCLLQGVKYGSKHGRSHLARVLYLLSFDNHSGAVGKAFDKYGDHIPLWVWLMWIPQLLISLQRPEAASCKNVVLKLAAHFPQALYYWLRTYLLERRDIATKAEMARGAAGAQARVQAMAAAASASGAGGGGGGGGGGGAPNSGEVGNAQASSNASTGTTDTVMSQGSQGGTGNPSDTPTGGAAGQGTESGNAGTDSGITDTNPSSGNDSQLAVRRNTGSVWPPGPSLAVIAFEAAKDIMEALRTKHNNLATELEVMLTEIGARFVPLPEERLLAVVHALLHRCYKYPAATTAEVPQSLKKELSGVCRACFSTDTVSKHVDFVNEYKRDFERDLDPDSTGTFPATLAELTERLKHWKGVLQSNVEDRLPAVLKLEEECRQLREFHVLDVEVPGQYFNDEEVAPDHTVKLDRIGADVPIVRRHGSSHRRLTMVGSDGSQRHFLVQTSLTPSARSDERMVQLFRVLNRLLEKHKESRHRHLAFNTPIIIPVWPQVRLVEDDLMYSTFGEVYEINCARYGREANLPITHFKERLNQALTQQLSNDAIVELRLHTYNEITNSFVSENVFSQYMYKTLPTCNHLWTFKKQFAVQLALSGFMSYMLQIGGRSPNKILFAKNTGKVFQNDFHPAYDMSGLVEFSEPVPFRLTRNLQTFFTPFGVEGFFVSSMCAAAQAIVASKNLHMQHQLAMFFRDELISWSWRSRPAGMSSAAAAAGGISSAELKQKVTLNVDQVMVRIKAIAPQCFPEEDENSAEPPQSVQRGVTELVEAALRPKSLCMMDPTWHPWF